MLVISSEEFRCDPYEISPSGDMFWADKRNVEQLYRSMEQAHKDKDEGKCLTFDSVEDIENTHESQSIIY